MEERGQMFKSGTRSDRPTLLGRQISPVVAEQHPPPDGEMAEPRLPEDPGGDGGKEPRKENCWKPPCSWEVVRTEEGRDREMGAGDAKGTAREGRRERRWQKKKECYY